MNIALATPPPVLLMMNRRGAGRVHVDTWFGKDCVAHNAMPNHNAPFSSNW